VNLSRVRGSGWEERLEVRRSGWSGGQGPGGQGGGGAWQTGRVWSSSVSFAFTFFTQVCEGPVGATPMWTGRV